MVHHWSLTQHLGSLPSKRSHREDELAGARSRSCEATGSHAAAPPPGGSPGLRLCAPPCSLDPPLPRALGLASLRRRSPPTGPPPTELPPPPGSAWYPERKQGKRQEISRKPRLLRKRCFRLQGPGTCDAPPRARPDSGASEQAAAGDEPCLPTSGKPRSSPQHQAPSRREASPSAPLPGHGYQAGQWPTGLTRFCRALRSALAGWRRPQSGPGGRRGNGHRNSPE